MVPGALFKELAKDRLNHHRDEFLALVNQTKAFKGLIIYERRCLCDALQEMDYDEGEYLYKEGEAPKGVYIIRKGLVLCTVADGDVKRFGEDSFFGAADIINGTNRNSVAKVVIPSTVLFLDINSFKRVLPLVLDGIEELLTETIV